MPTRSSFLFVPIAAALVASLAACGSSGPSDDAAATGSPSPSSPTGSASGPVTLTNCGRTVTVDSPPKRAVTMNQSATEVMLTLGLADHMAGTAYLDDTILPSLAADYAKVPVLAKEYPNEEKVRSVEPDFVYAAYSSAFDKTAAGAQGDLAGAGIQSYLSPFGCADKSQRPKTATLDAVFGEVRDIARIFGVSDRAEKYVAEQQAAVQKATKDQPAQGLKILWYDSDDNASPYVGACCGGPELIIDELGGTNVFGDVQGSWADVSWEQFPAKDPDVIVLADASWSTAEEKEAKLEKDPATKDLTAVKNHRFVVLPFSATSPGIRTVSGIESAAEQIRALHLS